MTPNRRSRYAASAYGSALTFGVVGLALSRAGHDRSLWGFALLTVAMLLLGLALDAGVDEQ